MLGEKEKCGVRERWERVGWVPSFLDKQFTSNNSLLLISHFNPSVIRVAAYN